MVISTKKKCNPSLNKYKVISTFSGCGGSSLGYKMGGLDVVAANEFIPAAYETYKANFPDTLMLTDDIRKLKGKDILNKVGLKVGELDVLDGSPPCASFSKSGKREANWGKEVNYSDTKQRVDDLFFEYTRLIDEIQPKVFVGENVKGLIMGKAYGVFEQILAEMRNKGYNVSARLLDAKYFNIAQNRERLIFIGVRKDLKILPSHPLPAFRPISVRQALKGVRNQEWELKASKYKEEGSTYKHLIKMKQGETGDLYAGEGKYFNLARLYWDKPANTVLQSDGKHISSRCIHPEEHRRLTISEIKRISSFPDNFILTGDYAQQWERIGRAVCPRMMEAVARHIRLFILNPINKIKPDVNEVLPFYHRQTDEEATITMKEYEALLNSKCAFEEYGNYDGAYQTTLF
jgi:DNA (cytosine-5)-methyltransferase 1